MVSPANNKRRSRPAEPRESELSDEEDSDNSSFDSYSSSSYDGLSSGDDEEPTTRESEHDDDGSTDNEGSIESSVKNVKKHAEKPKDDLARLLASDSSLTSMEINHRCIKNWALALPIEDIMIEISKQASLKSLTIDFQYVTMAKYDIILDSVRYSETMIELTIVNAKVNRHTANAIATALAQNRESLARLSFKKCSFAGSGFSILLLGIQHVAGLTHLAMEDCCLQGFASEIISASIPLIKTLKYLKLVKTQLPVEGLRFLFDNLQRCRSLKELDLSKNDFTPQAVSWLVGCLQSDETKIKTLSLVKCGLDAACIEILARGIVEDKTLEALNLASNPIGNSGAISIINMLKENHLLTRFSARDCEIGKKSSEKIHNALRYNNSFLKNMFSADVSLAILDSVTMMEKVPKSFA
jgi:Leucine Rich repeat